jgi:hypothetical protein
MRRQLSLALLLGVSAPTLPPFAKAANTKLD